MLYKTDNNTITLQLQEGIFKQAKYQAIFDSIRKKLINKSSKMKNMIYQSKEGTLDLTKITRLYPAVVIEMQGEIAEMSLEWFDLYGEKVKLVSFVLVFDFTKHGEDVKIRTVLNFETKDALIATMQEVSQFFQE